jgi:hypothetical protein
MLRTNDDALKLMAMMQYGMQYLLYSVSQRSNNVFLLQDYLKIQQDKAEKFLELMEHQVSCHLDSFNRFLRKRK